MAGLSDQQNRPQSKLVAIETKIFAWVARNAKPRQGSGETTVIDLPCFSPAALLNQCGALILAHTNTFQIWVRGRLFCCSLCRFPAPWQQSGFGDDFYLGAHAPPLAYDDISVIHKLWLDVTGEKSGENAHHQEIFTVALGLLEEALKGNARRSVLEKIRTLTHKRKLDEEKY